MAVVHAPTSARTARLDLLPPVEADRADWIALHRDPRTYEHAPHAMAGSDEQASTAFDVALAHWAERGFGFWVARERATAQVVGVGGLRHVVGDADAATDFHNLYYRLAFDHLGRGLGKELARAAVAYAVEWLPDVPTCALVKGHNAASVATAWACGLEPKGTRVLSDDLPDEPPSVVFHSPCVERLTAFDDDTRAQVLDLWVRVTEGGGAVGFVPGDSRERHDEALAAHEGGMAAGAQVAVVLRSGEDGAVVGIGFWVRGSNPLLGHTRTAYRIMTDPARRGRNLGRLLMSAMHRVARADGVEVAVLGVRGGTGTEAFYESSGYVVTGRTPGMIRVAPGDDREDITMARRLDDRPLFP